jgi:hypothetical protein
MKPRSARYRHGAVALKVAAAGAMLVFAALASAPACARDSGSSDSDWERLDQVLVIPPVYKPAAKANAPAAVDPPAASEGCGNSQLAMGPGGAIAVAGTADCQSTNTVQTQAQRQDSGPTGPSGSSQAATSPAAQSAAPADAQASPPVGTIDDYRQQQETAAELGANQMPPPIVVGPPLVPYYLPRTYQVPDAPMARIYVPTTAFPRAPWMPRPSVPMVSARPPMRIPPAVGSFGVTPGFIGMGGWRRR